MCAALSGRPVVTPFAEFGALSTPMVNDEGFAATSSLRSGKRASRKAILPFTSFFFRSEVGRGAVGGCYKIVVGGSRSLKVSKHATDTSVKCKRGDVLFRQQVIFTEPFSSSPDLISKSECLIFSPASSFRGLTGQLRSVPFTASSRPFSHIDVWTEYRAHQSSIVDASNCEA